MKTKRIALLLAALMLFGLFLTACGDKEPAPAATSPTPSADGGTGGNDLEAPPIKGPADIGAVPSGAIDFSDGKIDWLAVNLSPGDADPSDLSVIDWQGAKALKVTVMEGNNPYLGIDVSSLFGDSVSNIRKIEMRIWTEHPDGTFYATSGVLELYTGENNKVRETPWGVALERNNPRVLSVELAADEAFAPGARNILILKKSSSGGDLAAADGQHPANIIIDYMAFYDASGSVMQADTSASFAAPAGFGSTDNSFLFEVTGEVTLDHLWDGASGKSTGWGQAAWIDPDEILDYLVPGSIVTIYYKSEKAPEMIFQSYPDSAPPDYIITWGKVAPYVTNASGNIVQYRYEDIVAGFGADEFDAYLDKVNVGDWGVDLEVNKVTIGQRVEDELPWRPFVSGHDGFIDITDMNCVTGNFTPFSSVNSWSLQFRANTTVIPPDGDEPGTFKPEWLAPGAFITVLYESAGGVQFAFQKYADPDAGTGEIWAGVESDICRVPESGIDQLSFEAILESWADKGGAPDFSDLNAFWYQNRNEPLVSFKVILYTPNP